MKDKTNSPEIINVSNCNIPILQKAIINTEKNTFIENNSIFIGICQGHSTQVEIYPTTINFIVNVFTEYGKLLERGSL